MTRKDYVKFAAMLKDSIPHDSDQEAEAVALETWERIVRKTADIFDEDNGAFDRERFYRAAGLLQ